MHTERGINGLKMASDKIKKIRLTTGRTVILAIATMLAVDLIFFTGEEVLKGPQRDEPLRSIESQQAVEELAHDLIIDMNEANNKPEQEWRNGIEATQPR